MTTDIHAILQTARQKGQKALSEYESKLVLAAYGIPTVKEELVTTAEEAVAAAGRIGYPVVAKVCSPEITHKTEGGLVALNLRDEAELTRAVREIQEKSGQPNVPVLVQAMLKGARELVLGMTRDPLFGPCVMFGLGGIFTEALGDVAFRPAPLDLQDAKEMVRDIKAHRILDAFRGMPAVDSELLARSLVGLGELAVTHEGIREIDINPMIVCGDRPEAADALVVIAD